VEAVSVIVSVLVGFTPKQAEHADEYSAKLLHVDAYVGIELNSTEALRARRTLSWKLTEVVVTYGLGFCKRLTFVDDCVVVIVGDMMVVMTSIVVTVLVTEYMV
jgi:hypothetical protein